MPAFYSTVFPAELHQKFWLLLQQAHRWPTRSIEYPIFHLTRRLTSIKPSLIRISRCSETNTQSWPNHLGRWLRCPRPTTFIPGWKTNQFSISQSWPFIKTAWHFRRSGWQARPFPNVSQNPIYMCVFFNFRAVSPAERQSVSGPRPRILHILFYYKSKGPGTLGFAVSSWRLPSPPGMHLGITHSLSGKPTVESL